MKYSRNHVARNYATCFFSVIASMKDRHYKIFKGHLGKIRVARKNICRCLLAAPFAADDSTIVKELFAAVA